MGGSLAMALRGRVGGLAGVDRHAATRQLALRRQIVETATDDLTTGIANADLVVLATPVRSIITVLEQLPHLRPEGCMLLDLGSTKQEICTAMEKLPDEFAAVGGHPMCGKETAGLQAADANLYRGQTFVLTRNARTTPAVEAAALAIVSAAGARPLFMEAEEHDRLVAMASHVPYLISAALMHCAAAMDDNAVWAVSASGFRDTSRLSGSDPRMMLDILLTNRDAVSGALSAYRQMLEQLSNWLETTEESTLSQWLYAAQHQHVQYRQQKSKD